MTQAAEPDARTAGSTALAMSLFGPGQKLDRGSRAIVATVGPGQPAALPVTCRGVIRTTTRTTSGGRSRYT